MRDGLAAYARVRSALKMSKPKNEGGVRLSWDRACKTQDMTVSAARACTSMSWTCHCALTQDPPPNNYLRLERLRPQ
eukprot:1091020-Prymnesium_polylepis.1